MRNRLRALNVVIVLALASVAWMQAPASPPGTAQRGMAHRFQELAPGVYAALPTGTVNVVSNSLVVINQDDVLIVDSHATPAAARVLVEEIKTLTPKPVKYVVDTHHHWDHAHGNQIFGPDVQLIGHEYVRQMLLTDILESRSFRSFIDPVPGQIETIRKQLAAEADATRKQQLATRLAVQEAYWEATKEIKPTPPNVTYQSQMTLMRGDREIRLLFLGRGHTGGDTVIYLPKEKIAATGDLIVGSLPFMYMGDAFLNEWPDTMEKVLQLDVTTIVPGHGDPFTDKERVRHYQAYLRDLWNQAAAFKTQGVPADEAARRVDLTSHKANLPTIQGPGVDVRGMTRISDVLDGRLAPR
jgi:glyoxylase-like metal-dependent hydrolase (beta-lactamase superfamily II)